MLIKNACVVKRFNKFKADAGMERVYDYRIDLTERQFNDFLSRGLPVKKSEPKDEWKDLVPPHFWINVTPVMENGKFPDEDTYLNRDDVDIDFEIFASGINDRVLVKLYFAQSGITEIKKRRNKK